MKKIVTKFPVPNILLGFILIAFAVYATFASTLMLDGIRFVFAALIIVYSSLRLYKDLNYYKRKSSKSIATGEFVISIILAILLAFDVFALAIVVGLILYIKGATFLLILQVRKTYTTPYRYLINLVLITLGTFIFFSNRAYEDILVYVLFAGLTLYGIILLYYGFSKLVEDSKKKKSSSRSENPKPVDTVSEPVKVNTQEVKPHTYTKKALMEKNVDELKQMCKTRNLKGYSTLNKEQLVEKLWLYDHQ
ncbi:hypothetical protein [Liberiplasma polymorphum]|uniref:hypothetical protein n=1 Tax=Liberiplasma polymorphum TaxID=3374570 RepID=UPI00377601DF